MHEALSKHARKRMQQRAITVDDAHIVLAHGDRVKAVGAQAVAVTLTAEAAKSLAAEGTIAARSVSRLSRLAVVVAHADSTIITVAWLHGRKRRSYTRGAAIH
ncbi:DUF4258 domain-containing protein [Azospirillum soli]|uniref:DUF4258 domain-containing protein n=1 Tax=Azospirillum soli TaxID=1304799 RepID=UPI001AE94CD3|nr:DUF4258 domain-containing protein [Azospirillum soli]MBP2315475.1 hypothetical protein [Azospirillum soli]